MAAKGDIRRMLPGPIFTYELLTSGRRSRYFLIRGLYAVALAIALWSTWVDNRHAYFSGMNAAANVARDFFFVFSYMQIAAILLLVPAMVAGSLAQEFERRTIDYLFTSQLSLAEIVIGKYLARVLHVAFVLLSGVPIVMLASLMGGIPFESVMISTVVSLLTLLATAALSIGLSVWSRRAHDAVIRTYVVLAAFLIVPLMLVEAVPYGSAWQLLRDACNWLITADPFVLFTTLTATRGSMVQSSPLSLLLLWSTIYVASTAGGLGLALVFVRRAYAREGATKRRRHWALPRWRPRMGADGMLWKELFAGSGIRLGLLGRAAMWLMLGGAALWIGYAYFETLARRTYNYDRFAEMTAASSITIASFLLLLCVARGATTVTNEKERDCWLSLISTPLAGSEIVRAKVAGNLYAFRAILLFIAALLALGCSRQPAFIFAAGGIIGVLGLLAVFASCLGVFLSLRMKTSLRALSVGVIVALFLGGGYLLTCCMPVMIGARGDEGMVLGFAWCAPFLLTWPLIVYEASAGNSRESALHVAFVLGVVSYVAATVVLWILSVNEFDRLAGRIQEPTRLPPVTRPAREGPVIVEATLANRESARGEDSTSAAP